MIEIRKLFNYNLTLIEVIAATWVNIEGLGEYKMGIHNGSIFNINDLGVAESVLLNTNPNYQNPKAGDVMKWGFGAD